MLVHVCTCTCVNVCAYAYECVCVAEEEWLLSVASLQDNLPGTSLNVPS